MKLRKALYLVLLLFFVLEVSNANDDGLNVIKTKRGFLFVFNDSAESFLVEIEGKKFVDVEPEELIFSIDGQIVQFTIVPLKEFLNSNVQQDTLQQHFEFEGEFISKNFKVPLEQIQVKKIKSNVGRKVYFWELERNVSAKDTSSETVVKQIYATTNTNSFVVMISSPITRGNNYTKCRKRVVDALRNIQFKVGKYDLEVLRNSLRKN